MSHTVILLLTASFFFQVGPTIRSGTITQQAQSKDCALNIANVAGNVTVQNCPGVPARALDGLNRELRARRLSEGQAKSEAENWRRRYEELQASLASMGLTDGLVRKANSFLADGKLNEAAQALDAALKLQDQGVLEAANTHYMRSKIAELQYQPRVQEEQLAAAYQLAPKALLIAMDYGNLLKQYGQPAKAETIFKSLVEDATVAKALWLQAAALINMAGALQLQGKLTEAKETNLKAASLWELCYQTKCSSNALENESVAYSGAANIARQQAHIEEARQLIEKSLTLGLKARDFAGTSRDERDNTGLDHIISNAVSINIDAGNFEMASILIRNARNSANKYKHEPFQQQRADGDLSVSECLIKARQRKPAEGLVACRDALNKVKPLADEKHGDFKPDVAHTYFIMGLVQEDLRLWRDALESFRQASAIWENLVENGQTQFKTEYVRTSFYLVGAALNAGHGQEAIQAATEAAKLVVQTPEAPNEFKRIVLTEAISVLSQAGKKEEALKLREVRASVPVD